MIFLHLSHNQRGGVLVVSLMFMVVLRVLGTAGYLISSNELKISSNYKSAGIAQYAAEAGIEETRARLRGSNSDTNYVGDPVATFDNTWTAYILTSESWQPSTDDPNYKEGFRNYIPTSSSHTNETITANSLQSNISYLVKIKHKTEYDAEQAGHTTGSPHYTDNDGSTDTHDDDAPGNFVLYGYPDSDANKPTLYTTSGALDFFPVDIIRSYGKSGGSIRGIEVEVVRDPGPPVKAAIYAKGDVDSKGNITIDGNDGCGEMDSKPPIYTLEPYITTISGGSADFYGNPAGPDKGDLDIDIDSYVNSTSGSVAVIITEGKLTNENFGSEDNYVTCYADATSFHPTGLELNNVNGYGTLLVKGDLTIAGNFFWKGLVLCAGVLEFKGGGTEAKNIEGAVLANWTVTISGSVKVTYDSCIINKALSNQSRRIISWKAVY